MKKTVFNSKKVNSFRLTSDQAGKLNLIISETPFDKVGPAITFFADKILEQREQIRMLTEENTRLQSAIENPQSAIAQNPLTPPIETRPEISFDIFEDERLQWLKVFRLPEHKHPFDLLVHFRNRAEQEIMNFMHDPLRLVSPEEYKELKRWTDEELRPGLKILCNDQNLDLDGRQIFLLILDYAKSDPVSKILEILSPYSISEEDKAKIQDQQFPRTEIMTAVYNEYLQTKAVNDWSVKQFGPDVMKRHQSHRNALYTEAHESKEMVEENATGAATGKE